MSDSPANFTRVLMGGGRSLNLMYADTIKKMHIEPARVKPSITTFKGIILGIETLCLGSITLVVVFSMPDNFRSEELLFDIVPFRSGYHALLSVGKHSRKKCTQEQYEDALMVWI